VAAVALLATAAAVPVEAGLRYRFAFEDGRTGTVWVDGARCRTEFAPAEAAEAAEAATAVEAGKALYDLRLDDGERRLYVDSTGETYWNVSEHGVLPVRERSSLPFVVIAGGAPRAVLEPSVQVTEEDYAEPVAGLPTRKFVIRIRYLLEHEFPAEVVRATVSGIWLLWTTAALEGRPCGVDPGALPTGLPEIDALLEHELAKIPGFPVMRQLSVTHRIHRGTSTTGLETLTLDGFETVDPPRSLFAVPAGYRHQAPVFSGPGVEERVLPGGEDATP